MKTLLPAAVLMALQSPVVAQMCSGQLQPLKPLTPLGCSDTVAVCLCDANGNNCRWKWECTNGAYAGGPPAWSIPLMGQPPKIMSPIEVMNQAEQLRQMRLQTEMMRQQAEQLRRQNEAKPAVDWDTLAKQYGATVSSTPPAGANAYDVVLAEAPPAFTGDRFQIGPRLHYLIYLRAASESNPWNIIQGTALILLRAKAVKLDGDAIRVEGLDDWGRAWMARVVKSYED